MYNPIISVYTSITDDRAIPGTRLYGPPFITIIATRRLFTFYRITVETIALHWTKERAERWAADTIARRAWLNASELPDDFGKPYAEAVQE